VDFLWEYGIALRYDRRLDGFEPATPGSEVWRMTSQRVVLRIKQNFCVSQQNSVFFVKYQLVTTCFVSSISKLLTKV